MAKQQGNLKYVKFSNGCKIPSVGLGTFTSSPEDIDEAVTTAVEVAGYRHIDTAFMYKNEAAIGATLKRLVDTGKVKREELFIVTKLPQIAMAPEYVETYLKKSLVALQLNYVDLYLIHCPCGYVNLNDDDLLLPADADGFALIDVTTDLLAIWKKMEEMVDKGLTKSIGLSNFNIRQIQRILDNARIKPVNLQVECHAYLQQKELHAFCRKNDIAFTAYAPLGSPSFGTFVEKVSDQIMNVPPLLEDLELKAVAERHHKTVPQVLLRWHMERGMIVIPKSVRPGRIITNIDVFDFELTIEDTKAIESLDRGIRIFSMDFLKGITTHPEYPF